MEAVLPALSLDVDMGASGAGFFRLDVSGSRFDFANGHLGHLESTASGPGLAHSILVASALAV
jgi:predicted NBD/HSP70 family sugar kinase